MANKRKNNKNKKLLSIAQRMLTLERAILTRNPKQQAKQGKLVQRGVKLHPVAQHAFIGLTTPDTPGLKMHWPDHMARASLKYSTRARGNIEVSAGGAQVFFPFPSLSRDQYHYGIMNLGTSKIDTTSANFRTGATSYFRGQVTNMPFDDGAIRDGIVGRCLAVHVKVKYVGNHLNRCGQVMFMEVPDKNLLATNAISDDSAITGWGSELVNDQFTRYVNLATEGEADFVFHPFLWSSDRGNVQSGWVGHSTADGLQSFPAYANSSGSSSTILFGNTGVNIATPHGCLQIHNPSGSSCTYQYEATFHFEFAGRLAHSMSTPSPVAPPEDVTKVRNALLHAKMEHARDPHNSLHEVARSCLKEIEDASVDTGKDLLRMVGSSAKASVTKKLAEGLAMLAL